MTANNQEITEDELALKEIDQLHAATLNISNQCFEYKKMCITVLGAISTIFFQISKENLNESFYLLFIVLLLVTSFFWMADATAYYYQAKLRGIMRDQKDGIEIRRGFRAHPSYAKRVGVYSALFNSSMIIYFAAQVLFCMGLFWTW